MKDNPIPVTYAGDERIELQNCYVFRDGLAHRAQVSIASAVSYTDDPHLFHISITVPGSKKMTLDLGIPFPEAMRLTRHVAMWDRFIRDYELFKQEVVMEVFQRPIADLMEISWKEEEVASVRKLVTNDEMQDLVKSDLLSIGQASLEGNSNE